MKTGQKLEIGFGIATFVMALMNFLFFSAPSLNKITDIPSERYLLISFIILVLPEFFIATGAYSHSAKQSRVGFILLLFFGILLVMFHGWLLVTGIAFYGPNAAPQVWFGLSPAFFAVVTIFFAVRSRHSLRFG